MFKTNGRYRAIKRSQAVGSLARNRASRLSEVASPDSGRGGLREFLSQVASQENETYPFPAFRDRFRTPVKEHS